MERADLLETILDHYSAWYDITRCPEDAMLLAATAAYHEHDTGFALIRKAEMWSADRHEYVWFYSVPHLDMAAYRSCFDQGISRGQELVKPDKGHMSTNLVIVFLCDSIDDDVCQAIRSCRIRKNFMFSLRGWMEVHVASAVTGSETVIANRAAAATERFLNSLFRPVKRKQSSPFSMIRKMLD